MKKVSPLEWKKNREERQAPVERHGESAAPSLTLFPEIEKPDGNLNFLIIYVGICAMYFSREIIFN